LAEYKKHVESDKALERRFQKVVVNEPSVEATISILRGLKSKYEIHHQVKILDSALVAAAKLTDRYVSGRFMPDKAIDVVDEAAAKLNNELNSRPEALDKLQRELIQLEMERLSLLSANDDADDDEAVVEDASRLDEIDERLDFLKEATADLEKAWAAQRDAVEGTSTLKDQIAAMMLDIANAEQAFEFERASKLTYIQLPALKERLQLAENWAGEDGAKLVVRDTVTPDDCADIVSAWTGIQSARLLKTEANKLLDLENTFAQRVVGQPEACSLVADAVRKSRAGLGDPTKPIAAFAFLGPTGVGKTELAKALAEEVFDDADALVRIDMSEYGEKHTISRLVGAPPGYVGYDQGGQLTEAIRRKPYSVVLFDEMEKAHPEVFDVMLQMLDDGRLTDGSGVTVSFRDCIILFTSNVGSSLILDAVSDFAAMEDAGDEMSLDQGAKISAIKEDVIGAMRQKFRPEFINRLDEIVVFNPLKRSMLAKIVRLEAAKIGARLVESHGTALHVDEAAIEHLVATGFDAAYGARPLKRAVAKAIEPPLARLILAGDLLDGDSVHVSIANERIVLRVEHRAGDAPAELVEAEPAKPARKSRAAAQ